MKRVAALALASSLALGATLGVSRAVFATPFSDVPANHWAYQYVQSLAADGIIDGYPDGKFKGDRPLTRYEMAVVVARAIAKLQENRSPVSKQDLDKLQKLIDALKDELDALGVRVTNLEDSLDALDKRTKFAQSVSLHGNVNSQYSQRDRVLPPVSIVNGTVSNVTTYYGATIAPGRTGPIDPFVQAFLTSDESNSPLTQAGPGLNLRSDDRFALNYQITENVQVSFPVHVLNYNYGGAFIQQSAFDFEPGVDVSVARAGALQNLHVKFGIIDDMKSSRTGLTFQAPSGDQNPLYLEALQPYQKGFEVEGTLSALTDFQASVTRIAPTEYNTQPFIFDAAGATVPNAYLYLTVPPQASYTQALPPGAGAYTSTTFNSGTTTLAEVFLPSKAQLGSVYISQYDGATFDANGTRTGGPAITPPAATYNDAYNAVVFTPPIPAGSSVTISYRPLGNTANTNFQRYMVHARVNQKIKGYAGAEVGVTFNRVFDYDAPASNPNGAFTTFLQAPTTGFGAVSDTVLGIDFQAPIHHAIGGRGPDYFPVLYAEAAGSKFTPDYHNVAPTTDTAAIVGLRFKIKLAELSLQYQSVGPGFLDGAPFRYFGNPPALFTYYRGAYLPDFFGFANNVGINTQFDNQFLGVGAFSNVTQNPNLTYLTPVFNPFRGSSPTFFQAYTPNTQGIAFSASSPVRVGDYTFKTTATYAHLEELRPNSSSSIQFGPGYASNTREHLDSVTLGTAVTVPAFGQKIGVSLNGTYERLNRPDQTAFLYYPFNPGTQSFDPTAYANALANLPMGISHVPFYPNFVDVKHYVYNARVSVPLTSGVALDLTYTGQRYAGEAGTTLTQNISEKKDFYTGAINYTIPKTNSTVGFTYRNYRYSDDVMPTYNYVQNREDVNFTIRF
ncbi:MAG: S-layer homology domain-containing protein [Candidatus Eremiobacteraeota bacterium]|nr:S-layer homology domain-containing protein [Candidatus Eremiobacteraeota bacterium]